MTAIATSVDTASKEFRANQAAMGRALVAELEDRRAKAAEGGFVARPREAPSGAWQVAAGAIG